MGSLLHLDADKVTRSRLGNSARSNKYVALSSFSFTRSLFLFKIKDKRFAQLLSFVANGNGE